MNRFDNQTVIVTGGSRGMGASHVRGFIAEGASVVIADVLDDEGKTLADELGEGARFQHLDVTNESQWAETVAEAERVFGPVSVLVNNAGVLIPGTIEDTPLGTWQRVIGINLTGQFLGIKAVIPSMREAGGGSIVNVSSVVGLKGVPGIGAYVASKWASRGLTKTAALELARDNIRVNSIHPGFVQTPMTDTKRTDGARLLDDFSSSLAVLAIPRMAQPDEITRQVLFVASAEASFSTGSEFIADGGDLLGPAM
jgi:3alpha(or 20beta)-hydroxysteroid dehydrogenase